jgi:hypothetical protein
MDQNQISINQILLYAINSKVLTKFGKYYYKRTTRKKTRLPYMRKYIRPQFKHIFQEDIHIMQLKIMAVEFLARDIILNFRYLMSLN